jgi:hypothetical protein
LQVETGTTWCILQLAQFGMPRVVFHNLVICSCGRPAPVSEWA